MDDEEAVVWMEDCRWHHASATSGLVPATLLAFRGSTHPLVHQLVLSRTAKLAGPTERQTLESEIQFHHAPA